MRDQSHADHTLGLGLNAVQSLDDLDAAALAAPTRMNLCLYDPDRFFQIQSQSLGNINSIRWRKSHAPARNSDSIFLQKALRLIFMNVHKGRFRFFERLRAIGCSAG